MEEHIFVIVNELRVKIKMSYHISYMCRQHETLTAQAFVKFMSQKW
jgi:hypothetical protein